MGKRQTLFAKTGITLTIATLMFLVFCVGTMVIYLFVPLAKQGSDDLAALMVLSARTWVELPPSTRPFFETELMDEYQLKISAADESLPPSKSPLPYLRFLEAALEKRIGTPITIRAGKEARRWFCVDIPMGGRYIRVSFPWSRIGARPPTAALMLISAGAVMTLLTSLLLVRRLTRPLARLTDATSKIGRGEILPPLPERGPRELADLTHNFNKMAGELSELLENRTTLLAGISHDLRTPLTRMQLALEMLSPDGENEELIRELRRDMQEMNVLIGHALELARGLESRQAEEVDIQEFVDGVIADYKRPDTVIEWQPQGCCLCSIDALALQRIMINLLDNAIRYSNGKPVTVQCYCDPDKVVIKVLDRGKGIPESEREAVFRPFYRLETSRSKRTGGSGLGLAIARQLSDTHGWEIELLPRAGGGTEARIQIPREKDASGD